MRFMQHFEQPQPQMKSTRNGHKAFTLIELLVIIAIISILAAILFPVFGRARENARRSSCQSNLKQMGLGVMQYLQDYDEYYPRCLSTNPQTPTPTGKTFYFGTNANLWSWYEIIYPYVKSEQIYRCPSGKSDVTLPISYHYGSNRQIMRVSESEAVIKQSAVPASASVYLILDAGVYQMDPAGNARNVPPGPASGVNAYLPGVGDAKGETCGATESFANRDCQSGRHFNGINMAFADGHVKWLKGEKVYAEAIKTAPTLHGAWNPSYQ